MNPVIESGQENVLMNRKKAALRDLHDRFDFGFDEESKTLKIYKKGSGADGKTPIEARDANHNPIKLDEASKEQFRIYHNKFQEQGAGGNRGGSRDRSSGDRNNKYSGGNRDRNRSSGSRDGNRSYSREGGRDNRSSGNRDRNYSKGSSNRR